MKNACLLFLLQLHLQQVKADLPDEHCAYWTCSKGFGLPEYTERRVLNDVTIFYHDSTLKSKMPCPAWLSTTAGKEHWSTIHHWSDYNRNIFTSGYQSAIKQFNQTGSLSDQNIYQVTGCCSLYPNGTYTASMKHAFNGKDFLIFDINTKTFIAAARQAFAYKNMREADPATIEEISAFYKTTCLDRLKILKQAPDVNIRKVPEVRIFKQHKKQKAGSVTVTCHVTGFYPREVQVVWLGPDLQPVDEAFTEVLPNGDGTYQTRKSVIVPEEDVGKHTYSCVVLHISVPHNLTTVWGGEKASGFAVWISLAVWIFLVSGIGLCVWWLCKTRGALLKCLSPFSKEASTDEVAPSTLSHITDKEEDLRETAFTGTMASTSTQIECAPFLSTDVTSTEQDAVI